MQPWAGEAPTVPSPIPSESIPAFWQASERPLLWASSGFDPRLGPTTYTLARAVVASPVLDLMPWYRGAAGSTAGGVPIWAAGAAFNALIYGEQNATIDQLVPVDLAAYYVMRGHTTRSEARALRYLTQPQEWTSDFYDGNEAAFFATSPPAGLRYWQCFLVFDRIEAGANPALRAKLSVV